MLTSVEERDEEIVQCGNVFTAASAQGIDKFEGRLSALCSRADWLRHTLTQLLLLCKSNGTHVEHVDLLSSMYD